MAESEHLHPVPQRELCIAEVLDFDGLPVVRFSGTAQAVADAAAVYTFNIENPLGWCPEEIEEEAP